MVINGWLLVLLGGLLSTICFWAVAQNVSKKALLITASVFCLAKGGVILFSIYNVGGWKGLGFGIFSVALIGGAVLGSILGFLLKKK